MGKLFTSILSDRISSWAEEEGLVSEAQFGFRKNRRTSDAIFILNTAVQSHKRDNGFIAKLTSLGLQVHKMQVDDCVSRFEKVLQDTLHKYTSVKCSANKKKTNPFPRNTWFDKECKAKKSAVNRLAEEKP